MTSPFFTGARVKPVGVRSSAMSCVEACSASTAKALSCRSLNSASICSVRARYSSLSNTAGIAASSSWTSLRMASRSVAPRPAGRRSARGRCGWSKLLT